MRAISLAIAIGILWNSSFGIRSIFNLGELLNWHTIWYPILPLSVAWLVVSLMQLLSFKSRFAK